MKKTITALAITALLATPIAAEATTYKGNTSSGHPVTMKITKGKLRYFVAGLRRRASPSRAAAAPSAVWRPSALRARSSGPSRTTASPWSASGLRLQGGHHQPRPLAQGARDRLLGPDVLRVPVHGLEVHTRDLRSTAASAAPPSRRRRLLSARRRVALKNAEPESARSYPDQRSPSARPSRSGRTCPACRRVVDHVHERGLARAGRHRAAVLSLPWWERMMWPTAWHRSGGKPSMASMAVRTRK